MLVPIMILGICGFGEAARILYEMPNKNDKKVEFLRDYLYNTQAYLKSNTCSSSRSTC